MDQLSILGLGNTQESKFQTLRKTFYILISPGFQFSYFRFFSSEFYPVDGKGYTAEFQPDCVGTYHNFG